MHYLVLEGRLTPAGFHRFPNGNWAQVFECEGFRFHRPCERRDDGTAVAELDEIEAKPRGATEPKLKDAIFSLEAYLAGRPAVEVYMWPAKERAIRGGRDEHDEQAYSRQAYSQQDFDEDGMDEY